MSISQKNSTHELTTGEVAIILRISKQTVRRMIDSGELGGHRVRPGSPRKVLANELQRYIRENNLIVDWATSDSK